jgi:hypothetical protein
MFHYDPQLSGHSTTTAPRTNSILWSYNIDSFVDGSPVVADEKVYIGAGDGAIYCLDASTGSLIWSYMTGWLVLSSPAVANGRVYIGSYDESVYCFGSIPPTAVTPSVNDVTIMKKRLNLAWTRSTDPQFAKYEVFRSVSSGVLGTSIADITNIATTNMDVTGLSPSTTYYFTVRTIDSEGLYADSTQIAVTTALPLWLQPWFLGLIVAVIAIVIIVVVLLMRKKKTPETPGATGTT